MKNPLNKQDGEDHLSPSLNKFSTPSPIASEGSETDYESGWEELTPRSKNKPCGEGANPDCNPNNNDQHQDIEMPLRPFELEFSKEKGAYVPESTATMSSREPKRKRGQHGRHQLPTKVFAIHEVGKKGEPLEPVSVISKFSNACGVLVRESVDFNIDDWKNVDALLKNYLWQEIKKRFTYPPGTDDELNKSYALSTCAKALRQFRWNLNQKYVKNGEVPFKEYGFITEEKWDEFVRHHTSEDAMTKSEKFSLLAKRNLYPHHLGTTGYAPKKKQWRREEKEAAEAGKPTEYDGLNERTRDFLKARRPKQLVQGKKKFNEPQTEEVENKILAVAAAEQAGTFMPYREKDQLSAALGNPEHRGRVRGMSSRMSWKDAWASNASSSNASSNRICEGYKDKLSQEIREETVEIMVMEQFRNIATSDKPEMVQLRSQLLREAAGSMKLMQQARLDQGLLFPSNLESTIHQELPVDSIASVTPCTLSVPWGRKGCMKEVATGMAIPGRTMYCQPIPADYAKVLVVDVHPNCQMLDIDLPILGTRYLRDTKDNVILWDRRDIVLNTATPPLPSMQPDGDKEPLAHSRTTSKNDPPQG